jgi:hypothetical protein
MTRLRLVAVTLMLLTLVLVTAPSAQRAASPPSLVGVWRMASITNTDGQLITPAQPGLIIFTPKHYSIMMVTTAQPRAIVRAQDATKEELMAVYGGPAFQAQSGTYATNSRAIVLHPIVSKSPSLMMTPNVQQSYEWTLSGTTLTLVGPGGGAPTTYVLQRAE